MKNILSIITGLAFLLTGCIIVDDFKGYWAKGTVDARLEGQWEDQGSKEPSVIFVHRDGYYEFVVPNETPPSEVIRTLGIGSHTFLMIKSTMENPGGDLIRYSVEGNTLTFYSPNEKKREEFLKQYKNRHIVLDEDTIRFTEINRQIIWILQTLSAKPDYWAVTGTYTKIP